MSNDLPLISIIIPVYNTEKYLRQCLDSVIQQTYPNLEVLLMDNGSTDASGSICEEYARQDRRLHVYHVTKNIGPSGARNELLKIYRGELLGFIDADDWVAPDYVETLYKHLGDADMVVCGHFLVDGDKPLVAKHMEQQGSFTTLEYLQYLLDDEMTPYTGRNNGLVIAGYLWNKLYRRKVWSDIRFEGNGGSDDSVATTAYVCRIRTINYIPDCKYYYRILANSSSHKVQIRKVGDFAWVRTRQREIITNYTDNPSLHSQCDLLVLLAYGRVWKAYHTLHLTASPDYASFSERLRKELDGNRACLQGTIFRVKLKFYTFYHVLRLWYCYKDLKDSVKQVFMG
jgi:glycosyltransferase involved in cell wall biosynthesis